MHSTPIASRKPLHIIGGLVIALLTLAGCKRGPSEAELKAADERDLAEAAKLDAETRALEAQRPALEQSRVALAPARARLEARRAARAGGRWHLVLSPDGAQLAFFSASRPLGLFTVTRTKNAPPPPPGEYRLVRMQVLLPPEGGEPPNIPGRPKTAGGMSRLVFGAEGRELFYLAARGAPARPAPPPLPGWLITAGELDGLSLVLKPGDPLFVTAPDDPF